MSADLVKANVSTIGAQTKAAAPAPNGVKIAEGKPAEPVAVQKAEPTSSEVKSAVEDISRHMQNIQRNLNFSIDEDSGSTVVKVIDTESEEVIRQYPSEEILEIRRHLTELSSDELTGILVKTKA